MTTPRKRILLVEDDPDDIQLFSDALNSCNADVELLQAINGFEALRLLNSSEIEKPTVIFSDLNMPIVSGFDFYNQVKKNPELAQIPFYILTTQSSRPQDGSIALINNFFTNQQNFPTYVRSFRMYFGRIERPLSIFENCPSLER